MPQLCTHYVPLSAVLPLCAHLSCAPSTHLLSVTPLCICSVCAHPSCAPTMLPLGVQSHGGIK